MISVIASSPATNEKRKRGTISAEYIFESMIVK